MRGPIYIVLTDAFSLKSHIVSLILILLYVLFSLSFYKYHGLQNHGLINHQW
jgi:hypothetical protein